MRLRPIIITSYENIRINSCIISKESLQLSYEIIRNMSEKPIKTTEKELEILQIVWERGSASVKDIHEAMGGDEANGYTTILKFMQIMHDKGLVTREKNGKLHIYSAVPSLENTRQQLLDKMINTI